MIASAEEFIRLRNSDAPEDYLRAAGEAASVDVWMDVLARFPEMKEWVVHNKTVPLEVLGILAVDDAVAVRATVADKRKLNADLFDLLAGDSDELVRQRVACNRKAPVHVLQRLSKDPSPFVRRVAEQRLKQAAGE